MEFGYLSNQLRLQYVVVLVMLNKSSRGTEVKKHTEGLYGYATITCVKYTDRVVDENSK